MAEEFTAKFRVDISDLKKNISDAKKEIKLADAAFKAGTAGMDDWTKDADGLSRKLDQLKTTLSNQKTILESYRQQLERQKAAYEENGNRAQQLKAKLQELASQGVEKTSKEYKDYESALKQVLKEQDNNAKSVDDLKLKILNQEAAVGKTEKELRNYTAQLDNAGKEALDLASSEQEANAMTGKLGDGFTVMKGVISNLITQGIRKLGRELKSLVTDGAAYADEVLEMADKTSLATDTIQKLNYMSGLMDVELSTVSGSLVKLTKNMNSARGGTGSAAAAFEKLGVSVTDANGDLRDNEDVFYELIGALGSMENETERDALAMTLLGKSATELNPLIEAGTDALAEWAQEAEDMGYVLDDDMLGGLSDLQDSFDRFNNQIKTVKNTVAAGLAPAIDRATKKITEMLHDVDWTKWGKAAGSALEKVLDGFEWILTHGKSVKTVISMMIAALAASKIMAAVSALGSFIKGLKLAKGAMNALTAAINANPIMLIVTACAAAMVAIAALNKKIAEHVRATDEDWQRTDRMTKALDDSAAAAREANDAYASMTETLEKNTSAGIAEGDHLRSLREELEKITDANGQVAESDQARAQMILNELNQALGTEYTMTGNVINQYDELQGSIDGLIQKKQALLILEAEEEAYKQAVLNLGDAELRLRELEEKRLPIQQEMAANEERIGEILSMNGTEMAGHASELAELTARNEELNASLQESQEKYEATRDAVDGYTYDIQQYTANATAAIAEDYDSISHKSFEVAKASGEASTEASQAIVDNTQQSQKAWLDSLGKMVTDATGKETQFRDAGEGMVQAYVNGQKQGEAMPGKQVEAMAQQMLRKTDVLNRDMVTSGGQIPKGVASGIYNNAGVAYTAISALAQNLLYQFNAQMQIKSPSKKMAWSALQMILGLKNEVEEDGYMATDAMEDLAKDMTGAFNSSLLPQGLTLSGLSGAAQAIAGANPAGAAYGALGAMSGNAGAQAGAMTQNFTQIINAPKAPSRIELYRQTKNLLAYAGGGMS